MCGPADGSPRAASESDDDVDIEENEENGLPKPPKGLPMPNGLLPKWILTMWGCPAVPLGSSQPSGESQSEDGPPPPKSYFISSCIRF